MICPHCNQHIPPVCPVCGRRGHWQKGRKAADGTRYTVYQCNEFHRFVATEQKVARTYWELKP